MDETDTNSRILVCDVDDAVVGNLSASMSDSALELEVASNGEGCLDLLARKEYEVVLIDLGADELSGLELLEQIHDRFPETLAIALSSAPDTAPETAEAALAKGAYDFFSMPTDLTRLRWVVDRALERVRLTRTNGTGRKDKKKH